MQATLRRQALAVIFEYGARLCLATNKLAYGSPAHNAMLAALHVLAMWLKANPGYGNLEVAGEMLDHEVVARSAFWRQAKQ